MWLLANSRVTGSAFSGHITFTRDALRLYLPRNTQNGPYTVRSEGYFLRMLLQKMEDRSHTTTIVCHERSKVEIRNTKTVVSFAILSCVPVAHFSPPSVTVSHAVFVHSTITVTEESIVCCVGWILYQLESLFTVE
jgi:hypothetical protein